MHAGLLEADEYGYRIADPVIAQHLPPPVRIHHISDLHFGPKSADRVDAKDGGPVGAALAQGAGVGPVRDDYRDWLGSLPTSRRPHLLVVSGDLAEFAKGEEFAAARQWLEQVESMLAAHPELADGPRLLLVGGNHDVDWKRAEDASDPHGRHAPMAEALPDWPRPRLERPPSDSERSAHLRYPGAGLEVALLGSAEYGGEIDPEIHIMVEEVVRRSAAEARKELEQKAE
ncbi:MAG: metallophosphoesterase, partial [Myxococcales bacterium]|nr:metallophosphoesterase [Myxococcales bacterium]